MKSYHFSSDRSNENLELFEAAIRKFDVTVINETKSQFIGELVKCEDIQDLMKFSDYQLEIFRSYIQQYRIEEEQDSTKENCFLRLAKEFKFIDRYKNSLDNDTKLRILYYFFEKPLILDFNELSIGCIYKGMELYKLTKRNVKFVYLGREVDPKKLLDFQVFQHLKDLSKLSELYKAITERCQLFLQGKTKTCLAKLVNSYEQICTFTEAKDIFRMLKDENYRVGNDKEELPNFYARRTLSVNILKVQTILDHCINSQDVIIINLDSKIKNFHKLVDDNQKVLEIEAYLKHTYSEKNSVLILMHKNCSVKQFEEIKEKRAEEIQNSASNIHYLKAVDESQFMLMHSTSNNIIHADALSRITIHEENALSFFDSNRVNVVCAQPGMGKSVLMQFLTNECLDKWAVYVNLKQHNVFLKKKHNCNKILNYFMKLEEFSADSFLSKLTKLFLQKDKVALFLDSLDEIENVSIINVLDFVEQLSARECSVWLSSRQNLQKLLEARFNTFAITIDALSTELQRKYVYDRLKLSYNEKEIDHIQQQVFKISYEINKTQILGIPLQLYMITQIFLDNKQRFKELSKNIYIMTIMYRFFFEGRFKHSFVKTKIPSSHFFVETVDDYLEKYEILALQSLFNDDILQKLDLDLRRSHRFLNRIKEHKDPLGIIVKVDNEDKAVFEHFTFAEFFAAAYFTEHFGKVRLLGQYFFSQELQNVLTMFKFMLCEDNPLHLAMLNGDTAEIKKYKNKDAVFSKDRGGQTLLHTAACNAVRHPLLHGIISRPTKMYYLMDTRVTTSSQEKRTAESNDNINYALLAPYLQKDKVFELNALEYALELKALYIVEALLQNTKIRLRYDVYNTIKKYYNNANIAYYSLQYGYPSLLAMVLLQKTQIANLYSYSMDSKDDCILRFVLKPQCSNNVKILNMLIDAKIITSGYHKNTLLHFAVEEGDVPSIEHLLDKLPTLINTGNNQKEVALHRAAEGRNVEVVSLLLEKGADINAKEENNNTPLHYVTTVAIAQLLLSKGANVNQKNQLNETPVYCAALIGNVDVLHLFKENGADLNQPLFHAVERRQNQIIELLLNNGACINEKDSRSYNATPLLLAVINRNTEIVDLLIKRGADVTATTTSNDTVFHFAVIDDSVETELINVLFDEKIVDLLYVTNVEGVTPLHLAGYYKNLNIIEFLMKQGVDFQKINSEHPLPFVMVDGQVVMDHVSSEEEIKQNRIMTQIKRRKEDLRWLEFL